MSYNSPRDKYIPIKQVHPRVLQEDKACCYCVHYVPSHHSSAGYDGYCHVVERAVANYDECSAYTKRTESAGE